MNFKQGCNQNGRATNSSWYVFVASPKSPCYARSLHGLRHLPIVARLICQGLHHARRCKCTFVLPMQRVSGCAVPCLHGNSQLIVAIVLPAAATATVLGRMAFFSQHAIQRYDGYSHHHATVWQHACSHHCIEQTTTSFQVDAGILQSMPLTL